MFTYQEGVRSRAQIVRTEQPLFAALILLSSLTWPKACQAGDVLDPRVAIELTRAVTVEVSVMQRQTSGRRYEFGAGVVIHPSGMVATTLHTVDEPGEVSVRLPDESVRPARILKVYRNLDTAILKFETDKPHAAVRVSSRSDVNAGNAIVAGVPQRGERSLKLATVNAAPSDVKYRFVSSGTKIVSFEADISLGFSGGPVIDMNGELIGMILAKNSNGLRRGYCLPSDVLLAALEIDELSGYPPKPGMMNASERALAVAAVETAPLDKSMPPAVVEFEAWSPTLSSEHAFFEGTIRR